MSVFWCNTIGFGSGLEASGEDEGTGPITIGRRTEAGMGGIEEDACGTAGVGGVDAFRSCDD